MKKKTAAWFYVARKITNTLAQMFGVGKIFKNVFEITLTKAVLVKNSIFKYIYLNIF